MPFSQRDRDNRHLMDSLSSRESIELLARLCAPLSLSRARSRGLWSQLRLRHPSPAKEGGPSVRLSSIRNRLYTLGTPRCPAHRNWGAAPGARAALSRPVRSRGSRPRTRPIEKQKSSEVEGRQRGPAARPTRAPKKKKTTGAAAQATAATGTAAARLITRGCLRDRNRIISRLLLPAAPPNRHR